MCQSGLTIGGQAQVVLLFLLFLIDAYEYGGRHFISMEEGTFIVCRKAGEGSNKA